MDEGGGTAPRSAEAHAFRGGGGMSRRPARCCALRHACRRRRPSVFGLLGEACHCSSAAPGRRCKHCYRAMLAAAAGRGAATLQGDAAPLFVDTSCRCWARCSHMHTHAQTCQTCACVCVCFYTCVCRCVHACLCCAQARVCICSSCKALYRFLMLIDNLGTYSLLEWHSSLAPSLPFSADFFLPTPLVTHSGLSTPDPYHRLGLRELYTRRAAVRRKRTAWPVRV